MKKNINFFKNKSILITGATGSFGSSFLRHLIKHYRGFRKIIVFSRDELKQYNLSIEFPETKFTYLRYFLGDIRDAERLNSITKNIDFIVHAAALKQVPSAELNPFEAIKTNVIGAQNLIQASLNGNVKKVVALSTDKAVAPINLYGATKLCSDKLFLSANNIKGPRNISFSVARYGNVMASRGSVIPKFLQQKNTGLITITDKNMTRFNMKMQEAIECVIWILANCEGGEIVIPKAPSYKILDLKKAIAPHAKIKVIGTRLGEKLHEELITSSDASTVYDIGKYYINLSNVNEKYVKRYVKKYKAKKVKENFIYNSLNNERYLKVNDLRNLTKKIQKN